MGLREQKKRNTRDAILAVSHDLFRQNGAESTRVSEIAERAGVSPATFYNYFPSREHLLEAWSLALLAETLAPTASSPASRTARGRARLWARSLAARIEADRNWVAAAWRPTQHREGGASEVHDALRDAFATAQVDGEIRTDIPAPQLATLLVSALAASIGEWLHRARPGVDADRGSDPLEPYLVRAVDLLLDGSRKRNERVRAAAVTRTVPGP